MPLSQPFRPARLGQHIPLSNLNNVCGSHRIQQVTAGGSGFANTYGGIMKAPCFSFTHVRIGFPNFDATPGAITDLSVAVTASNTDKVVPTTGNTLTNDAGLTGWQRGLFSGSNGVTLAAAGADADHPSITWSDLIPLNSIPATDSSVYPYLMVRVKYSNAFTYATLTTDAGFTDNTRPQYIETYRTTDGTNGIINASAMTTSNIISNQTSPLYVMEFVSATPQIRAIGVGDSIFAGSHAALSNNGWLDRTQNAFLTAGLPVNIINYGRSGATSLSFNAYGKTAIDTHLPNIALYNLFTPNDGPGGAYAGGLTATIVNTAFQRAMDFARYASSKGALPVFVIQCPNDFYNSTDDGFRLGLINRAKANGIAVIDLTPAVSQTGVSPQRFITANAFDQVHPNDLGYAAMSTIAYNALYALISQSMALF